MSQTRLPKVKNPLADLEKLSILPEIIPQEMNIVVEEKIEEPVDSKAVFGKDLTTKDEMVNTVQLEAPSVDGRGQGKRGKDKQKRKKKVMSDSQLAALARGREKSRLKRAKKEKPAVMASPTPNTKLDYKTFSAYMDQYENTKKTTHSTSRQPHPNKIINERLRPLPPMSKPREQPKKLMRWTGTNASYQTHKKIPGNSRWNYM